MILIYVSKLLKKLGLSFINFLRTRRTDLMVKVQTKYVCEIENIGRPYKREGRSAEREREEEWGRPQKQTLAALSTKESRK